MSSKSNSPLDSNERSLHSASGFGKPSRPPFPDPGRNERGDAMDALLESLKQLNEETTKRPELG